MNKLLIVLLVPYCLLISCSEPENGGDVRATLGEVSGEGSDFPAGSISSHQIQQVVPAIAPTKINEGRIMPTRKLEAKQKAIACRPSPKLYGGHTFDEIVEAIIYVESKGNRKARSRAGACGLMQIMPRTWSFTCRRVLRKRYPWTWRFNKKYNLIVGRAYLKYCIGQFKNSPTQIEDGIRAYYSGIRGSRKGRGFNYLRKIKRRLRIND